MIEELFVVGDIHGELSRLEKLLTKWNPDSQRLIFLGDYIDRGRDSYGVIQLVSELYENYGAVALGGNHESMFLDWMDDPEDYWFSKWCEDESILNYEEDVQMSTSVFYYCNGGDRTVDSFYGGSYAYRYIPSKTVHYIKSNFEKEVEFLRGLPDYFEHDQYLFVHAGVNLSLSDWKNTYKNDFRWIRRPFHYMTNDTGKVIVFGHEPTRFLNKDRSDQVWVSDCKTKIGIDGCAVNKGLLHGLVIGENLSIYSVDSEHNCSYRDVVL